MTIRELARTDVVTAHRDQSTGNLATVMKEKGVGSVLVEDEGRPVGIVTDRDLTLKVLERRADPREVTAEEVVTETPTTVGEDAGVFEATKTMLEAGVRRMLVVDEEAIAGIVTLDDFLVLLTDELNALAGVVEAESPPY